MESEQLNSLVTGALVYAGLIALAFWAGMVIWTVRDVRARSRDALALVLFTLMVAVLTLPGFLLYLFLRPRETLAEAYERSLEEEALLQEIEDKPTCPGCRQRTLEGWQACPHCHTRLRKACTRCGKLLDLPWDLCPYCATPQPVYAAERPATATAASAHARPQTAVPAQELSAREARRPRRRAESIEFVEGEEQS